MAETYYSLTDIVKHCDNLVAAMPTSFFSGIWKVRNTLYRIPAADVAPVRHGRWRLYSPLTDTYECDKCGYQVIDESFRTNYCPNCGANMRDNEYIKDGDGDV